MLSKNRKQCHDLKKAYESPIMETSRGLQWVTACKLEIQVLQ